MKNSVLLKSLRAIYYYLNPAQKKQAAGLFVLMVIISLLDVFGLAAIIPVINIAADPGIIEQNEYLNMVYTSTGLESTEMFLMVIIIGILLFFVCKNVFILYIKYKQVAFIADVTLGIVENQFSKYNTLDFWNFKNLGSSRIINYVNQTPSLFSNYLMRPLLMVLSEMMIVLFIIVGTAVYQPVLSLILGLVLGPTTFLVYRALKNKSKEVGDSIDQLRPSTYGLISDAFSGYVDLRLTDKQQVFKERYMKVKRKMHKLQILSNLFRLIPQRAIETVAVLGIVLIFFYSLLITDQTTNILTLLGLFVAAAYRLMPSINRILSSMMAIKEHQFTIENMEMMREQEVSEKVAREQHSLHFNDAIEFEHVSFGFPDSSEKIVHDISFKVHKGEKVGFIGTSGSGKTTLLNILLRFYIEEEGAITVDGTPLNEYNIKAWRKMIGYVKQDVFLMKGSIEENITLCAETIDYERLNEAIDQASLRSFVDEKREGTKAQIEESGTNISGGQCQRIGIARALYHDAKILVFDEATSALDTETEREVTEAINKLSNTDITLFIVAHRFTTLKDCDRIYELKKGRMQGHYQYDEVIARVV